MPRTVSRSNEWKNLLKESITTGSLIISSNYEDKSDIKDKTLNSTTARSNQNGMDPSCEEDTRECKQIMAKSNPNGPFLPRKYTRGGKHAAMMFLAAGSLIWGIQKLEKLAAHFGNMKINPHRKYRSKSRERNPGRLMESLTKCKRCFRPCCGGSGAAIEVGTKNACLTKR